MQLFSFVRNYVKLISTLLDFLIPVVGNLGGELVGRGNGYRQKRFLGREYTKHRIPGLPDLPKAPPSDMVSFGWKGKELLFHILVA